MTVLAVVAHPDDEVLGLGGTAALLAAQGHDVVVHILAEGVSLRHAGMTLDQARAACQAAAAELQVSGVRFGGFGGADRVLADSGQRATVQAVEQVIAAVRPRIVFTHHPGDIHADHRLTARSVSYATRVLGLTSVTQVLHVEVLSSTEQQTGSRTFVPTVFYDVSEHVDAKCRALAAYSHETFDPPHPRSDHGVRALAAYRGTQVGVAGAEAFALARELRRGDGALG